MAFFDLTQGFWFGLGAGPVLCVCWLLGKLVDFAFLGDLKSSPDAREQAAYERGFQDGLRDELVNRASHRLDESIAEKMSFFAVRGKRLAESTEADQSETQVRREEEPFRSGHSG